MNAFLWALGKLNFPLGKEHVCWLKLLSLRILIRVCLAKQNKVLWTSIVPRPTAFQRGHSWSATHAPRVAGWDFVAFRFLLFFFPLHVSTRLYSLHSSAHQAGKHGHDHLRFHLHKIFRKSINSGTNSSCHGHSIPIHHGKMSGWALRLLPTNDKSAPALSNTISLTLFIKI